MRKLWILCAACLMGMSVTAQEIDAVKVTQGSTTDWYLLDNSNRLDVPITNGNPVFNGKTYDLAQGDVTTTFGTAPEDTWFTVREDGVAGNWNTICLEKNITAIDGATFWTVSGEDATSFILDEVTEPQAGYGYLIRFTAAELKVQYGEDYAVSPIEATADHPIQGTYEEIAAAATNVLVGNYVVYNNQLCPVNGWVGMNPHRAYVIADLVQKGEPAKAPGRARAYMPKSNQTPTELEMVDDAQCTMHDGKFLRNGQLVIVKDKKMFNAQGIQL